MRNHDHQAYFRLLSAVSDVELPLLHTRTAIKYPILARMIADEIARRGDAVRPPFLSPIECEKDFATAA